MIKQFCDRCEIELDKFARVFNYTINMQGGSLFKIFCDKCDTAIRSVMNTKPNKSEKQ